MPTVIDVLTTYSRQQLRYFHRKYVNELKQSWPVFNAVVKKAKEEKEKEKQK